MSRSTPADFWLKIAHDMETLETYFRGTQKSFERQAKSSGSMTQDKADLVAELQALTDVLHESGIIEAILDAEDYPLLFAPQPESRVATRRGTVDEAQIERLIGALQDAKDAYVDYYLAHGQDYDADIVKQVNTTSPPSVKNKACWAGVVH